MIVLEYKVSQGQRHKRQRMRSWEVTFTVFALQWLRAAGETSEEHRWKLTLWRWSDPGTVCTFCQQLFLSRINLSRSWHQPYLIIPIVLQTPHWLPFKAQNLCFWKNKNGSDCSAQRRNPQRWVQICHIWLTEMCVSVDLNKPEPPVIHTALVK